MFRIPKYYGGVHGLIDIPSILLQDSGNRELVPFLMNCEKENINIISSCAPKKIKSNCSFIVNLSQLRHPKDIFSDELGAWRQTDTSKKYYFLVKRNDSVIKLNKADERENDILVIRRTYKNHSDDSLHKTVVSIKYLNEENIQDLY